MATAPPGLGLPRPPRLGGADNVGANGISASGDCGLPTGWSPTICGGDWAAEDRGRSVADCPDNLKPSARSLLTCQAAHGRGCTGCRRPTNHKSLDRTL